MREFDKAELKIANKFRGDDAMFQGISKYYPKWLKTWQRDKKESELRKQTDALISHIKKALKGFGTGWGEVFYGCIPYDFIIWWGRQIDNEQQTI